MLYLVHFERPFGHATHYLGFAKDARTFERRIEHHRHGSGARLLKHVTAAGIDWWVSRTWPDGTQTLERKLKQHGKSRICPDCVGLSAYRRAGGLNIPTKLADGVYTG